MPGLHERIGRLDREALALVWQRDREWRRGLNAGSLHDLSVLVRDEQETAAGPVAVGAQVALQAAAARPRGWLHVDLDVLDPMELPWAPLRSWAWCGGWRVRGADVSHGRGASSPSLSPAA
ncbi:hypothetical protein [Motilibacter aurantiacus]|uniref:hypothetical protein n=1 Tax=Motilibacter aurantiacus TaxID=2714955 RepID=UPI00140C6B00|nr:hypothetical protein [Motilibacter aurantiacus]NHC46954.1 hypothetical protein [Motilibacter aurantiacus]